MPDKSIIRRSLLLLLFLSFVIRALLAGFTELGNDEVYYRLYALYPAWSHFDHPPMVGWVINLFTLNLTNQSEFFLRLGAVVLGTLNTWLIFLTGRKIKNDLTGLYAAFLYTASAYCTVIAGTFIMPDTPQVFFWLITLYLLCDSLPDLSLSSASRQKLLLAGVSIGLALLSKYHSVFLASGTFLYVLIFNRRWFKTKELYISFLIMFILFLPVIWWNYQNHFISFTFHEARVDSMKSGIRWDYLGTDLAGQFFYNNPVNVIIILISLAMLIKRNNFLKKDQAWLLLLISLPLSVVFLFFSLRNSTLPHWTGPAWLGYILIASAWLSELKAEGKIRKLLPLSIKISAGLLFVLLIIAFAQIKWGIIPMDKLKITDPTVQLTGYRQLGEKFATLSAKIEREGDITQGAPLIATNWFPAANYDYYLAWPLKKKVYAFGDPEHIHEFYRINKIRGPITKHSDCWYIGLSDNRPDPPQELTEKFDSVKCKDTLLITRSNKVIRKAYVFRMYGLK